jgi:transposase InsO family protein
VDRRSVRRTQRLTLDPRHLQHAVELRHQRLHLRHISRLLAAPFSTVARALNRLGLGRLLNLEPKTPVQRYERQTPGDLVHIDVKKLARFRKVGHRITGNRQEGRSTGVGYDRVHVAIDDGTRLAYVEVLADEQQATAICFMTRAVAWFNGQGVECRHLMSNNGRAYVSRSFGKACRALGIKHIRTRPYTPRTNGKAERFIQTLCREWAYGMAFKNSCERNQLLPRLLSIYNRLRKHTARGGQSPQQRLNGLLC